VVAGNAPPIIARLRRCLDGKDGDRLKAELEAARTHVNRARTDGVDVHERTAAALAYARDHRLAPSPPDDRSDVAYRSWPDEWSR
jgi:hypothetical protein